MIRVSPFLLLAAFHVSVQAVTVTCAGGKNAVQEGQSITCTSATPVTWSLIGVGSLSHQTSTSVTYTAPTSITPQHVLAGWPVMPNDSVLNTRIDNLPVNVNSSIWINGGGHAAGISLGHCPAGASSPPSYCYIGFAPGFPLSTATSSTPTINIKSFYGSGITNNAPVPGAANLREQAGNYRSSDGNDHHFLIAQTDRGQFFEIYHIFPLTVAGGASCASGLGCNATSAISYHWYDYATNNGLSGTNAASIPILPLTPFLAEFYSGAINHAIGLNVCSACTYGDSGTVYDMNQGTATLAGTQFLPVHGVNVGPSTVNAAESGAQLSAISGTISKVAIAINPPPGSGKSVTFQFRDNHSNLGPSCTISGSWKNCTITTVGNTAAGDAIDWRITTTGSFAVNNIYITLSYGENPMWPAYSANGWGGFDSPPMGTRLRLRVCGRNSVTTNCINVPNDPYRAILVNALYYYGAIIIDTQSSSVGFSPNLGRDIALDRGLMNDIAGFGVYIGNFDVVDESSLRWGSHGPSDSYAVCAYGVSGACAGGLTNTYEKPNGQAALAATANGQTSYLPIAIQGVTIRIGEW